MTDTRNVLDEMKGLDLDRIRLIRENRSLPFAVLINNVKGSLNTGVMIRNSNFYGASKVYYYGDKHWNRVPSVGCYKYMSVEYLPRICDVVALKAKYRFVGVENNIDCKLYDIYSYLPKNNSLYVFGGEGTGIDKEIMELCNDFVEIPNLGTVRSLNVSVCSGIVMSEHIRKSKTLGYKLRNLF